MTRVLTWDGGFNVRDLGGIPTNDGRVTKSGAFIRSGSPDRLTEAGWQQAYDYGVRTVVDMMSAYERQPDAAIRPGLITTLDVPLEDTEADAEWWEQWKPNGLWGTPLYYRSFLEAFPARTARVVNAIADAGTGGVLFHCGRGRDRTGMVAALLLLLAGVDPEDIADDYETTNGAHAKAEMEARGGEDDVPVINEILAREGTTSRAALLAAIDRLDAEVYLVNAGVAPAKLARLKDRLV